jgi:ribosomal protein S3AE
MSASLEKNFNYFLDLSFKRYLEGEWIAIFNNQVISHGKSLKDVISSAQKIAPLSKVLISKVKKTASYL